MTRSREIYEQLEHAQNVASGWNQLGITYHNWGKYEEAVTHYQEALSRYEVLEDEANVSSADPCTLSLRKAIY